MPVWFCSKTFSKQNWKYNAQIIWKSKLNDMSFEKSYGFKEYYFSDLSSHPFENIMFVIDECYG